MGPSPPAPVWAFQLQEPRYPHGAGPLACLPVLDDSRQLADQMLEELVVQSEAFRMAEYARRLRYSVDSRRQTPESVFRGQELMAEARQAVAQALSKERPPVLP
jgi:hypothetical protein